MTKEKSKNMSLRLAESDVDALDALAATTGKARNFIVSELVRELVRPKTCTYIDSLDIPHPSFESDTEDYQKYFLRVTMVSTNGRFTKLLFETVKEEVYNRRNSIVKEATWAIRSADGKWLVEEDHPLSRPVKDAELDYIDRVVLANEFCEADFYEEAFRTAFLEVGHSATSSTPGDSRNRVIWVKAKED